MLSKGLSAGAGAGGAVYFQPKYSSDTLLAMLSKSLKGEQGDFFVMLLVFYKSKVIRDIFGSSTMQNEWSSGIAMTFFLLGFHPSMSYQCDSTKHT